MIIPDISQNDICFMMYVGIFVAGINSEIIVPRGSDLLPDDVTVINHVASKDA